MSDEQAEVVVVGAGLAGLLCAVTLEELGLSVQVLEASDAVGGRLRTDLIDGFRCDRGFQLLNPAYPAVRRYVDLAALELRSFAAGVAVAGDAGTRVVADPRRSPTLLGRTLTSGYLRPNELARLAAWAAPSLGPVPRLLDHADVPLGESLDQAGVTGRLRREIFDPFFAGVLAEDNGTTSANFARLLLRSFLLGTPAVPAAGMAALPEQLVRRLRTPVVLNTQVTSVESGPVVVTPAGRWTARAVVVATDPEAAAALVPVDAPRMKGLSTYWFATTEAPRSDRLLVVDGRRTGPVVNSAVMSNVAPSYAPTGRQLVQATTLWPTPAVEAEVRIQLTRLYGRSAGPWELLVRHAIPKALPEQLPPLRTRQPVDLGDGLFVAGDHRDTASIQGALVSGRRAANAVAAHLGVRRTSYH